MRRRLARLGSPRGGGINPVLEPLIRTVRTTHPKADIRKIERAYEVAARLHAGQSRRSGDPYITHPLAVATILAELGMPHDTICAALLHDTVEDTQYTVTQIREEFGELPAVMRGDRKLLFALFSNLLSNAVKYSGAGDPIEIFARKESGENLLVHVRDHGIGISERDQAHLFERYFRGANAVGVAGSGVGLHLVAMVLDLHGGTIEVHSALDVGSSFIVRLPAAVAEDAAQPRLDRGAA